MTVGTILLGTETAMTISIDDSPTLANGAGRVAAAVDNSSSKMPFAFISASIWTGGVACTLNSTVDFFLVRDLGTYGDDGFSSATGDSAFTVVQGKHLWSIRIPATTAGTNYTAVFDTSPVGPLGPHWSVVIVNNTGQTMDHTVAAAMYYRYYQPESL